VSDLETKPSSYVCTTAAGGGPEELVLAARRVYLGRTTEVARVLPDRQIRMIGAWCFLDHYGPEDVTASAGMQVWAHPHTGLQTVSWLFAGAIEHRDSVGSRVLVRPGELNLMTAGHGVVHTELSPDDRPPLLHGVQLWVALPDAARDVAPAFVQHRDLPTFARPGLSGTVLLGTVAGVTSPAATFTPLCGAELVLPAGADVELPLRPDFEHGLLVVDGTATVATTTTGVDELVYLGTERASVRLRSADGARLVLVGGEPFVEEIVMWWNFVGRSHDEVVALREAWEHRADRFPAVVDRSERTLEAPPMPTVELRPRPRRRVR
jgi:redox-sensitive bicupin YhaK (pirin superfamily)